MIKLPQNWQLAPDQKKNIWYRIGFGITSTLFFILMALLILVVLALVLGILLVLINLVIAMYSFLVDSATTIFLGGK